MDHSSWRVDWTADGINYVATHVSGPIAWVSCSGFATVAHKPDSMLEDEARRLMYEAMELAQIAACRRQRVRWIVRHGWRTRRPRRKACSGRLGFVRTSTR